MGEKNHGTQFNIGISNSRWFYRMESIRRYFGTTGLQSSERNQNNQRDPRGSKNC